MTLPVIDTTVTGRDTTSNVSFTVTYPAFSGGDRLLTFLSVDGSARTIADPPETPGGGANAKFLDTAALSDANTVIGYYADAEETTAAGATATFTLNGAALGDFAVLVLQGGSFDPRYPPEAAVSGTTANVAGYDCPSLTPSGWGAATTDTLWGVVVGWDSTTTPPTWAGAGAWPANFAVTGIGLVVDPTASAGTGLAVGTRDADPKTAAVNPAAVTTALASAATNEMAFATWAQAGVSGDPVTSPALEISNFDVSHIHSNATITNVIVEVNHYASSAAFSGVTYELWDGASSKIGNTQTGTVSTDPTNLDRATFSPITYAQLTNLRVRVYATARTGVSGEAWYVDSAQLSVTYTPSANTAITGTAAAAVATIPTPSLPVSATVAAAAVAAVAGVPVPLIPANAAITGVAVAAVAGVPVPTVRGGAKASPTAVATSAVIPAPALHAGMTVSAIPVAATTATPPSVPHAGAQVGAVAVAAIAGVPATMPAVGSAVTLAAVAASAAVASPAVATGSTAAAATVAGAATAPAPTAMAGSTITATAVAAMATVPTPAIVSVAGPNYPTVSAVLGGGIGSWVNPTYATGSPDGAVAVWTVS